MSITAKQVQELRERTGAGMMACKEALTKAKGNIEDAINLMKIEGTAKAAKKAGRVAAEGGIANKVSADGKNAVMVEVNCETDFVGRDASFRAFVDTVAKRALATQTTDVGSLSQQSISDSSDETIENLRLQLITKLGENIQIRRVIMLSASGIVGSYVHGGRIGVLVTLSIPDAEFAKELAMHIAALNPMAISPKDVSAELIEKEKEIFTAQSTQSGKAPEIIEKMIAGRISKYLSEVSLLGQAFVKDPNKTMEALLKEKKAEVTGFARFELGEGIEKQTEDFVQAVKAQVSGDH
jgi:elongation factor Ts